MMVPCYSSNIGKASRPTQLVIRTWYEGKMFPWLEIVICGHMLLMLCCASFGCEFAEVKEVFDAKDML